MGSVEVLVSYPPYLIRIVVRFLDFALNQSCRSERSPQPKGNKKDLKMWIQSSRSSAHSGQFSSLSVPDYQHQDPGFSSSVGRALLCAVSIVSPCQKHAFKGEYLVDVLVVGLVPGRCTVAAQFKWREQTSLYIAVYMWQIMYFLLDWKIDLQQW